MTHEIKRGEKFALLAIRSQTLDFPSAVQLSPAVTAATGPPVALGSRWTDWLGKARAEHLATANLFLLTTAPSERPQVLDDENEALRERLWRVLFGLLLTGRITFDSPDVLLGAHGDYGFSIRAVRQYKPARPIVGISADPITEGALRRAWRFVEAIERWIALGPAWRINHALRIFAEARAEREIPERIHQFCRCVEGFVLPEHGHTLQQFKSRTELFIGPGNHPLFEKIYNRRSAVEHLNYQHLAEQAGRPERIELARLATIMEALARHCIARLFADQALWQHFRTDKALGQFWSFPEATRKDLWGVPAAVDQHVGGFSDAEITDSDLGL